MTDTWTEDGLTYTETVCQPYTNCTFSAGKVEGHAVDTMYLRWQRDDGTDGMLLLQPDEAAALAYCLTGALFGALNDIMDADDAQGLTQLLESRQ